MTDNEMKEILKDYIDKHNELYSLTPYVCWNNFNKQQKSINLDGDFTADELEAMAKYMRVNND